VNSVSIGKIAVGVALGLLLVALFVTLLVTWASVTL
jgi:hypothetical protein